MTIGILKTVVGDVTNPQRTKPNEIVVIPHCCNNHKIMGAGVALALKKKWPGVEDKYQKSSSALGSISTYYNVGEDGIIDTHICNMIGQNGTVSADNPKPVKYWALAKAMIRVHSLVDALILDTRNAVIHTPKFGSDLAMGDWNFILELIREIWLEQGIDVVVYEFG